MVFLRRFTVLASGSVLALGVGCSSPAGPSGGAMAGAPGAAGAANGSSGGVSTGTGGSSLGASGSGGSAGVSAGGAPNRGSGTGGVDVGGAGQAGSSSGSGGGGNGGAAQAGAGGSGGAGGGANVNPKAVSVFLLGGQSNATGQGYTKNYPTGFTINSDVQLYHSPDITSASGGKVWAPLRHASEPADGCGDRFGPELGFGNAIQPFYAGRQLAIIKHAKSNTNLSSQWAPGSNAQDTSHFGAEFKTFVTTVDGGMKALKDKGLEPRIVGMLWQQGEADVDAGGNASSLYGQHLSQLIARVREQFSVPDMLFVYGYVYPKSNYGTARDQVRAGEAAIDQDSGNALAVKNAFVVATDDLQLRANDPNTCYASDLIHFGTAGQLELGKRMAQKTHDHLLIP